MKQLKELGINLPKNAITQYVAQEQVAFGQRLMRLLITGVAETGEIIERLEDARVELARNASRLYVQSMEELENDA